MTITIILVVLAVAVGVIGVLSVIGGDKETTAVNNEKGANVTPNHEAKREKNQNVESIK